MPINVLMPALSPTMEDGALAKWLVKEGDSVAAGDVIAEIETDKATMEVEAVDEGVVGRIVVPEGSQGVKVNAVIAVLLEEGEEAGAADAPAAGNGAPAPAAPEAAPSPTPAPAPTVLPPPRPRRRSTARRASSPRRWRGGSRRKRGSTSGGQGLRSAWTHREGRCRGGAAGRRARPCGADGRAGAERRAGPGRAIRRGRGESLCRARL
jgi:pyruvate/2-oxoglutarate dehydrogenase complex dihydrolipoamide acyltransferase (E2) component